MIHDLDDTLAALLKHELPPEFQEEGQSPASVSFDTLHKGAQQSSALILNLFLYDIRENRDLRTNEWEMERHADRATKKRSPVRVECSYLITAWGSNTKTEHQLLGAAMKALLRHATIPSAFLKGSLVQQDMPLPTACLQPSYLQSLGEFWQAMNSEPKAALNYTVTISVGVIDELIEAPIVLQRVFGKPREGDK